jgi:hypothetical protein
MIGSIYAPYRCPVILEAEKARERAGELGIKSARGSGVALCRTAFQGVKSAVRRGKIPCSNVENQRCWGVRYIGVMFFTLPFSTVINRLPG